jgi:hypothetical protein
MQQELTRCVRRRVEPDRLEVGRSDLEVVDGLGEPALRKHLLGPGDEDVRGHPVVHRDLVRRGAPPATSPRHPHGRDSYDGASRHRVVAPLLPLAESAVSALWGFRGFASPDSPDAGLGRC